MPPRTPILGHHHVHFYSMRTYAPMHTRNAALLLKRAWRHQLHLITND